MNHVAFVIPGLDRVGGAERQVVWLAKSLARRNWTVSVLALSGEGETAREELSRAGVSFFTLRMSKGLADPGGWVRMSYWLRAHKPDIVHAHLPHAALLARWSRLMAPVRTVIDTVHTSATGGSGRRWGYRLSRWLSDCTTAVGADAAQAWMEASLIPRDRAAILYNGIDTERWKPDSGVRSRMRAQLGIGDDAFLWLAAGRLEPVKNYPSLLESMTFLPHSALLYIAGTGTMEAELRETATKLGIASRVQFLGFVDDLLPWMQAADGVVLASHWEGLPLVLLEAAACGLPAIATNVAGSREVIMPGRTGYLCAPGGPIDMANAQRHVMQLPAAERMAIGSHARERVLSEFSSKQIVDQWEELYRELMAERPIPFRFAVPNHAGNIGASAANESWQTPLARATARPNRADTD